MENPFSEEELINNLVDKIEVLGKIEREIERLIFFVGNYDCRGKSLTPEGIRKSCLQWHTCGEVFRRRCINRFNGKGFLRYPTKICINLY